MSDPWLIAYVVLTVVVVAGAAAVRVMTGRTPRTTSPGSLERAMDVAFVNGGRRPVTMAALAALRADELAEGADGRMVRASGTAHDRRDPLQRAVHAVAQDGPVRVYSLPTRRAIAVELDAIERRGVAAGFVGDAEPPRTAGCGGPLPWRCSGS